MRPQPGRTMHAGSRLTKRAWQAQQTVHGKRRVLPAPLQQSLWAALALTLACPLSRTARQPCRHQQVTSLCDSCPPASDLCLHQ